MASRPACLARSSFDGLSAREGLSVYRLQPWPVFVDAGRLADMERVALGLDALVKSLPRRLFGDDLERLARFYQIGNPLLAAVLLEPPDGLAGALSRGDFLATADGLKCLEWNCGSYLGGWQTSLVADLYLKEPLVAEFLAGRGVSARPRNATRLLFGEIVDQAMREGVWKSGPLNLAIVMRPTPQSEGDTHSPELYGREYAAALAERQGPAGGRIFLCGFNELQEQGGALFCGGEPVHAALELQNGPTARHAFRAFKAGRLSLFSGPITGLLSDKRNLALLSEGTDAGDFSAAERTLIRAHVPWTRRLLRATAERAGESVFLPDLLAGRRENLVIKHARSLGGAKVHVGRFTPAARWDEAVHTALDEAGSWVVQDFVESLPYAFQSDEEGWLPHDLVWGLFAFGSRFGGGFVRLLPKGGSGVVNVARRAEVSAVLEIERTAI